MHPPTHSPPLPASSHRRRLPCPPTNDWSAAGGVGSGKGPSLQDSYVLRPGTVGGWCGGAHVGLVPGLMREGANRMNRLRRAVGFCRPSCNGAALDGFAWLSPWPTCGGCAARTGRPGVQLEAGRRKPGLPHLLHLRDWSGGWFCAYARSDLRRSVGAGEWGCAGLCALLKMNARCGTGRNGVMCRR